MTWLSDFLFGYEPQLLPGQLVDLNHLQAQRSGFWPRMQRRFRRWRSLWKARKQRKCSHEVIGQHCVKCGWEMRILNIYHPPGAALPPKFYSDLESIIEPGTMVQMVPNEDGEKSLRFGSVGFDLSSEHFIFLARWVPKDEQ